MKRLPILLAVVLLFSGCAKKVRWIERREPVTDEQRRAIADHAARIIASTPHTLAGHDQDWDDAIKEAHRQATYIFCPLTLWEYEYSAAPGSIDGFTGRWKYAEPLKSESSP